ncbi:DUF3108 domain-containing protein [Azotobacter bryophylli]|uniref:DUF3108 domain-containing protein n=1 Tax=Azotobacter bryophylli TaxID=1986537 RepID=A0ABV7AZD1_9GAMM
MRRILLFALALLALPSYAYELHPFTASYTTDSSQIPVSGTAERRLSQQADQSWKLEFEASMMIAGLQEESTFRVEQSHLLPLSYRYDRNGLGKVKHVEQDFDWKAKKVTGSDRGKPFQHSLNRGLLDKSTYQIALQKDVAEGKKSMSYRVVDGDDIEIYDFRVLGSERVDTQAGQIEAIKVERVRDPTKSNRQTIFWLAKDWNYLLVRLHQVEKDGKEYDIMLKDGMVDGKQVAGK